MTPLVQFQSACAYLLILYAKLMKQYNRSRQNTTAFTWVLEAISG